MGSFGHHLCRALVEQKCDIMIADKDEKNLEDMLPYVVSAKIGDCTKADVLKEFGVESFDACFVCMGDNFQNSLQITSLLKELGAKKVYSKADEDVQAKFLLRNGADRIIYPDYQVAVRLAFSESSGNIFDCVELSKDYMICEIAAIPAWLGKSLRDLDFRAKYNMSILATKTNDVVNPLPPADYIFNTEDHVIVLGHVNDIKKVLRK